MSRHSSHQGEWQRVSRSRPCGICGKTDWCVFADGVALCMRVESPTPSRGDAGGWLHYSHDAPRQPRARRFRVLAPAGIDFARLTDQFSDAATEARVEALSAQLGVTPDALRATGIGWNQRQHAWAWPMHDHHFRIVGIRLRDARTHRKYAVTGSKQGVFLAECPDHFAAAPLVVVTEGPTDLCAASDLGFTAIGRPSCNGGTKYIAALTRGKEVVVVRDADEAGRRGAGALVASLLPTVRSVRVIEPPAPHKDLRAWLQAGGTPETVDALIEAAPLQTIRVRLCR